MTEHEAPSVAHRIVVPLANPATAEGLLRLAWSLVPPKGGRVLAVFVVPAGTEPRAGALEQLEAIVEELAAEDAPVELVTETATSIARGILDIAQDRHADLIVLGVRGLQRGKVILGPVVDAVARTAPCNVLVFRGAQADNNRESYHHILVPVDGSPNSRLAARMGLRLAQQADCLMTALYVQAEPGMKRWQSLGRIEAALADLEGAEDVRKIIVKASDVVTGVLSRAEVEDLVLLGFSERSSLDRWVFGDVPQRMLAGTPGPLILVKQTVGDSVAGRLSHRLFELLPTLTPPEQAEVAQMAGEMATPTTNYFMLTILSCLIASIGLLQNSPAVVIGAMLIAPLVSPLMGFAVGLTQGRPGMMRTAALTVVRGVFLALLLAVAVGLLAPIKSPTAEMLARGQPSLLDMGVALFSGAAGAYAMARKDIPSALAGVAIAAALMPPLCTVGLALAFQQVALAGGSFLLFLTNIVSVSLAGAAVFLWLGVRLRAGADDAARYRQRVLISIAVLIILALPLTAALRGSSLTAARHDAAWGALRDTFGEAVVDVEFHDGETPVRLVATVRQPGQPDEAQFTVAETLLRRRIGEDVTLELVWQPVMRPGR